MIAAVAAAAAIKPEPTDARLLLDTGSAIVAQTPAGTRKQLLESAQDAVYSPDGTFVAFARGGDLWLANADGSGERRLVTTPNVEEGKPAWLPDGSAIVYGATVGGRRQIRVVQLPTGLSRRLDGSNGEEYDAAVSRTGKLAFVSTRGGTPVVYVAQSNGAGVTAFDTTPPETPFTELHVQHMGGAVARVPHSDCAFAHRDARFFVNLIGAAADASDFDALRGWVRDLSSRLSAHALPSRMPNFSDADDQDPIARFGKDHARRLQELRMRYDPQGLFASTRHANVAC